MFRISACAPLLVCVLALGQQPQNPGQDSPSAPPPGTYAGDNTQQQPQLQTSPQNKTTHAQSQSDLQGALKACAVLLMAATSSACPGETSQQQPQPQMNFQDEAAANSKSRANLQSTLRACAMLLHAATSRTCAQAQAEDASQEQPPQPQASPHKSTQDKASTNSQILSNIQSSLNGDPILSGTDVQVSVDDVNITLTGSVQSQGQLDRVLALASPYVGYRSVVSHVVVQ
jgi:osmotically-inducible protein OsmY